MSFAFNIECLGKGAVACQPGDAMKCVESSHVAVWSRCELFSVNRRKRTLFFDCVVSNMFAREHRERLLSFGRTCFRCCLFKQAYHERWLAMGRARTELLGQSHARPTWQVGRATERIILFVITHSQAIRREVFRTGRPVQRKKQHATKTD